MLYIGKSVSSACRSTLKKLNIPHRVMPENPLLSYPTSTHPDMSAVTVGSKTFASGDVAAFLSCVDTNECLGEKYPQDVLFNGFVLKNTLFCNEKAFSKVVADYARSLGMGVENVKQGYAKCSCVLLGDRGLITADRSIAAVAKKYCHVLLINAGGILLPPYDYGFIGGASFTIGSNVFFFGDVKSHPSYTKIIEFISECGFTAISLSDEPLFDCGGAIWIDE